MLKFINSINVMKTLLECQKYLLFYKYKKCPVKFLTRYVCFRQVQHYSSTTCDNNHNTIQVSLWNFK